MESCGDPDIRQSIVVVHLNPLDGPRGDRMPELIPKLALPGSAARLSSIFLKMTDKFFMERTSPYWSVGKGHDYRVRKVVQ